MDNLFEKYGIKEVADVTIYRIETKEETYESQREVSISSVLKGAIKLKTVYPLEGGVGAEEGFEAYVFTDAELVSGENYPCDDDITVQVTYTLEDATVSTTAAQVIANGEPNREVDPTWTIKTTGTVSFDSSTDIATVVVTYKVPPVSNNTHDYSYEEQILMLFAKNQNLITKAGSRYRFPDTSVFESIDFDDSFATAPNSTERIVVVGIAGSFTEATYDKDEVMATINGLSYTFKAKAYDITYKDYTELLVEDEMGYYNPHFLGTAINTGKTAISGSYSSITDKDGAISGATQWKENPGCLSINDAIAALRKKKKGIDLVEAEGSVGLSGISGGYSVNADLTQGSTDEDGVYTLTAGTASKTSSYALSRVIEALAELSVTAGAAGNAVVVTDNSEDSNRAIYVKTDNLTSAAASSQIYLLRNVNYKKLAVDEYGIFSFVDKKGNTVYYQDTIFAGVEYLALVIVGTSGLIFTIGRFGTKKFEKMAWLVNDSGYITDNQATSLVKKGLIHTIDITNDNETFEATCSVSDIKVRKTKKTSERYVPVLFLDSLQVSTIETTATETSANGGKGNAKLISWDYNKEITLTMTDALYSPASMSAMFGSNENDFVGGLKDVKTLDRSEKCIAKRSFIVPAGNSKGVPSQGETTAQAVYLEYPSLEPYQDGAPIAEGEVYVKWTRSIAYDNNSLGKMIEISADKFPGTYRIVGDTFARAYKNGEDQRFQFIVPKAKMSTEQTISFSADGDPTTFDMNWTVLRPEDGRMLMFVQYDVVENSEENDGSTMVKGTENLNLLDSAEMFRVGEAGADEEIVIGSTEY